MLRLFRGRNTSVPLMKYAVIVMKGWPMLVVESELKELENCEILAVSDDPLELIDTLDSAASFARTAAEAQRVEQALEPFDFEEDTGN